MSLRVNVCALALALSQAVGCMHLFYDPSGPRTCERIETVWEKDPETGIGHTKVVEYGCVIKSRASGMILFEVVGVLIGVLALLL